MGEERRTITRRELLELGGLAASTALLPRSLLGAESALPQVPRRLLGKTGQQVPILLLGGASGFDPRFDPKIAEALRYGANYIDAADCYAGGRCETSVGAFHQRAKNRAAMWITSKSDKHDPEGFARTLDDSLKSLQTDYVDMYFLHGLTDARHLSPELATTVDRLKKTGKMRHFGFSCHGGNVVELLQKAASLPWVETVMFRYNFRQYGDRELNAAMDAAHRSGVGLIAMKTQGSEAGFRDAWKKFEQTGKWNKYQAVLKAVWADERISAAVSDMDTFEKLRANLDAALDRNALSQAERSALERYAADTRSLACDGCDHICGPAVAGPVRIGDTLRFLMYHDVYGQPEKARRLFQALPAEAQRLAGVDFAPANRACPHGVDVAGLMLRAHEVLAG
ncbi:MAG TPA: aldo/keto reductase [Thermoleophilia bacterium]|nr:aldo/keto reductase [Thermoleophilia bacterium]